MKVKAQTAVEMLVILAVGLAVLIIVIDITSDLTTTTSSQTRSSKAKAVLNDVASAAELVYYQGEGARTKVFIQIPSSVNSTTLSGATMTIQFDDGDVVYRNLDFNISGRLPAEEGNHWIIIESRTNDTIIYTEQTGYCGNNNKEIDETCDGSDLNSETCSSQGYTSGDLACYGNCTFDYTGCGTCGDGVVGGTEQCDGSELNGESCTSQGYDSGNLACYGNCTFDYSTCVINYPPTWRNLGANNTNPVVWNYVNFYSQWDDDGVLDKYIFSWNASGANCGTWINDTPQSFQSGNWTNTTKQIPFLCGGKTIGFRFYANDTQGKMNVSDISVVQVKRWRNATIVYYDSDNNKIPQYQIWNGTGLAGQNSANDVNKKVKYFNKLVSSPIKDEKILVTLDDGLDINIQIWNGSSWFSPLEVSTNALKNDRREFDVAYEQNSGDAIVVFVHQDYPQQPRYIIWNGSGWSDPASAGSVGTNNIRWIRLVPKPDDDDMILVTLDSGKDLYGQVWDGSSWGNVQLLDNDVETDSNQLYDIAWESQSGDAVVAYGHKNSVTTRYWIWNGSWNGEYNANDADDQDTQWVRLVADPNSNNILMGVEPNNKHLNLQIWDGNSWGSNSVVSETLETSNDRNFDIIWESTSGRAVVVYGKSNTDSPRYVIWDDSWSSPASAQDVGGDQNWIQLESNPDTNEILLMTVENQNNDAWFQRWNGTDWIAEPEVEPKSNAKYESFYISYDRHPY